MNGQVAERFIAKAHNHRDIGKKAHDGLRASRPANGWTRRTAEGPGTIPWARLPPSSRRATPGSVRRGRSPGSSSARRVAQSIGERRTTAKR
jgi:hypothetical protein